MGCSGCSKDGKRQEEDHHLSTTVQGARKDVVVLREPTGMPVSEPVLRVESDEHGKGDGGIDPYGQPCRILRYDLRIAISARVSEDQPSLTGVMTQ